MIIKENPEEFQAYLQDTSNIRGNAKSVIIPDSQEELQELIIQRYKKKYPLTFSAGRTGTTGGSVPLEGDVLSLEELAPNSRRATTLR